MVSTGEDEKESMDQHNQDYPVTRLCLTKSEAYSQNSTSSLSHICVGMAQGGGSDRNSWSLRVTMLRSHMVQVAQLDNWPAMFIHLPILRRYDLPGGENLSTRTSRTSSASRFDGITAETVDGHADCGELIVGETDQTMARCGR